MRQAVLALRLMAVLVLALALAGPATTRVAVQDETAPPIEETEDSSPEEDVAATEGEQDETPVKLTEDDDAAPDDETVESESPPSGETDPGTADPGEGDAPTDGTAEDGVGDVPADEQTPPDTMANGTGGDPPAEETPAEEPPVEEPTGEEPPTDEPPVDEPSVDEPPVEASPVEESPVEATPDGPVDEGDLGSTPSTTDDEVAATPDATPAGAAAYEVTVAQAFTVTVTTVDAANPQTTLNFACYDVYEDPGAGPFGNPVTSGCDSNPTDGVVEIGGLEPGSYVLVMTQAPTGFLAAANRDVDVANADVSITVQLAAGVREQFDLRTYAGSVDPNNLLGDACFAIFQDLDPDAGDLVRGALVNSICDIGDGNPGQVLNAFSSSGNFIVVETVAPPGFDAAADQEFTVVNGQTTTVNVVDTA